MAVVGLSFSFGVFKRPLFLPETIVTLLGYVLDVEHFLFVLEQDFISPPARLEMLLKL